MLTVYYGLPMVIVGQLVNLWTYGVLTKRDRLVTSGPYAWCRNPFYVGTFLTDFGFCVMCDPSRPVTLGIIAAYAVIQGALNYQQMFKEERLLKEFHGERYDDYRRRVRWRLLPSPISAIRNGGFSINWSGRLALHNKIFSRIISHFFWVSVFWALALVTHDGRTYLLAFDVDLKVILANAWLLVVTGAMVALYYTAVFVERWNRKKEEQEESARTDGSEAAASAAGSGEN